MPWKPIRKSAQTWSVLRHLQDYDQTRAAFSWEAVRGELAGLPGGRGLNIAHEAVDRHANGPRRDDLALRWLGKNGAVRNFTCADLSACMRHLGLKSQKRITGSSRRWRTSSGISLTVCVEARHTAAAGMHGLRPCMV